MRVLPPDLRPAELEAEIRAFWLAHGLPPAEPRDEPMPPGSVVLDLGPVSTDGPVSLGTLERLVVGDVAARYLALSGKAVRSPLFVGGTEDPAEFDAELAHHGIWFGSGDRRPIEPADLADRVAGLVHAMASSGVLVARADPSRYCPRCASTRTAEGTVYQEEQRGIYLVRVPVLVGDHPVSAIVWTDALWKLLGMEAVLLHPDRPYVRARVERHGRSEEILVARGALGPLADWLPGITVTELEERPGSQWSGLRYQHPLAAEMPVLQLSEPPAGTLQPCTEVEDRGTGLVPLVPGHGPADAEFARSRDLPGRNVVDESGLLSAEPRQKYSGLPLDTAEACLNRDLHEDGGILTEIRQLRGVPHCGTCGVELIWRPGRVWCLDIRRVPSTVRERFERAGLGERFPDPPELLPWPASQAAASTDPRDPELAECAACGRLAPPPGPPHCPCGAGAPRLVRRRLLPDYLGPLVTWARLSPLPVGASVWIFLPDRRRTPALIHQLLALEASGARPAEIRTTVLRTISSTGSAEELVEPPPADAIRAALLRLALGPPGRVSLAQVILEEARRYRSLYYGAERLLRPMVAEGFQAGDRPITAYLSQLLAEDLAFLSAFERMRLEVSRLYDRGEWGAGFLHGAQFIDHTLRECYLPLIAPRLGEPPGSPSRQALFYVLAHLLPRLAEMSAPVYPHLADVVHRAIDGDANSAHQLRPPPIQETLLDPAREGLLERWSSIAVALARERRRLGLAPTQRWAHVVLNTASDEEAVALRPHIDTLRRLVGAEEVAVYSPAEPWTGRHVTARPNVEELRRAYPVAYRRIMTVLAQLDGRRIREALRAQSLSVALEGQPAFRIPASMMEIVESLPERYESVRWRYGELFVELPANATSQAPHGPLLSPDLGRVFHHISRRLHRLPAGSAIPPKILLWAEDAFRPELRRGIPQLAEALGGPEVIAVEDQSMFRAAETTEGRTRRGIRFRLWVPGVPMPPRRPGKLPRPATGERLRIALADPRTEPTGTDFLSPEQRERSEGVRALLAELDSAINPAFLGPAKLEAAWDADLRSSAAIASAEFDRLASLPGFGPVVARELLTRLAPERVLPPPIPAPAPFEASPVLPARAASPDTTSGAARPTLPAPVPPEPAPGPSVIPDPTPVLRRAEPSRPESPPPMTPTAPAPSPPAPTAPAPSPPTPTAGPAPSAAPPPPPAKVPGLALAARPLPPPPPAGGLEIRVGPSRDNAWDEFLEAVGSGTPGLWVGRVFPSALQASTALQEVHFLWLSTAERPNSVRPTQLDALGDGLARAMGEGGVRAVILEEIEYLAVVNGVGPVRAMLRRIEAAAKVAGARVWIPLVPELLGGTGPEEIVRFASEA